MAEINVSRYREITSHGSFSAESLWISFIVCIPFCRHIRRIISGGILIAAVGTNANALVFLVIGIELYEAEGISRCIDAIVPVDVDTRVCIGGIPNCPEVCAIGQWDCQRGIILGYLESFRGVRFAQDKPFLCS